MNKTYEVAYTNLKIYVFCYIMEISFSVNLATGLLLIVVKGYFFIPGCFCMEEVSQTFLLTGHAVNISGIVSHVVSAAALVTLTTWA